jgi:hypothetical protein
MLFPPREFEDALGMGYFHDHYRWAVGLTFLVAFSWLSVASILGCHRLLSERRQEKRRYLRLHKLTADERMVLRLYLNASLRSLSFSPQETYTAQGLADDGILSRPEQPEERDPRRQGTSFSILEWARGYLSEHPELVEEAPRFPRVQTGF